MHVACDRTFICVLIEAIACTQMPLPVCGKHVHTQPNLLAVDTSTVLTIGPSH